MTPEKRRKAGSKESGACSRLVCSKGEEEKGDLFIGAKKTTASCLVLSCLFLYLFVRFLRIFFFSFPLSPRPFDVMLGPRREGKKESSLQTHRQGLILTLRCYTYHHSKLQQDSTLLAKMALILSLTFKQWHGVCRVGENITT